MGTLCQPKHGWGGGPPLSISPSGPLREMVTSCLLKAAETLGANDTPKTSDPSQPNSSLRGVWGLWPQTYDPHSAHRMGSPRWAPDSQKHSHLGPASLKLPSFKGVLGSPH